MSSLIQALGIDNLSAEDRLRLAQEIWDSLREDVSRQPLSEAQAQELDRRVAALDARPGVLSRWEDVEARVLARVRR